MKNWHIDMYAFCKNLIPHFLQKVGQVLNWVTGSNLIWITPDGQSWGTGTPSRHLDWIKSLLAPLQSLHERFFSKSQETLYIMSITGQVIYLERYLNDLFDNVERRIYIDDGTIILPPYLYNIVDNEVIWYLYNDADDETPFYIYNQIEYSVQGEFVIHVPSAIPLTSLLISQISAAVDRFKQAGVRYKIVPF